MGTSTGCPHILVALGLVLQLPVFFIVYEILCTTGR